MDTKIKILLTVIGLAAILVPAALLIIFSKKSADNSTGSGISGGNRELRQDAVQNELDNNPLKSVVVSPSPVASPVAVSPKPSPTPLSVTLPVPPLESTPGSGVN
ncbi:MAG: hypothetical protein UU23_C0001G0063 [Candidatus Curtissbacteria bacterium GW2011_GWA1_40_9]|uniref:Uncharacterized protein n=1 Tax=Candidatus Curtissbacteria bacterium GW2011_GWA1_40_9 TaxID=1618408 RepID=A0A0G0TMP1_9BACT|nr:MAG: hypothetical protein UU23_C0001G0063 [Candidatus Curtissbacteria bacterium GW2011_GWA1_40_9]